MRKEQEMPVSERKRSLIRRLGDRDTWSPEESAKADMKEITSKYQVDIDSALSTLTVEA